MDGTLLATDVLWEQLVVLAFTRPWLLVRVPFWLAKGKAFVKRRLAVCTTLDPALLPYRGAVIAFLVQERSRGREVILATASDRLIAERVARHVHLFSAVLASDGRVNLAGRAKLSAILNHANGKAFDYLGDSSADVPIWQRAARVLFVGASRRLVHKIGRAVTSEEIGCPRPVFLFEVVRMLRIHQWSKNTLLLIPLLLAHQVTDIERVVNGLLAFMAFSLAASAVYIVNDLADLESDRQHPRKCARPLATGAVPIAVAVPMVPLTLGSSILIASVFLPTLFTAILLFYIATTTAYSLGVKRIVVLDVVVLAGLYTLRVLSGAVATEVAVSPWFLAFSMFFFLSLAVVKRYTELRLAMEAEAPVYLQARGYRLDDLDLLKNVGPTSGYLAVGVLALYINSPEVHVLYTRPAVLWLIGPLILYWMTRVWLLAHRGQMHGDPVVFAITDLPSYLLAGLIVALIIVGALA
jgi:4-hydroxybenzoate polyprenyltransferase